MFVRFVFFILYLHLRLAECVPEGIVSLEAFLSRIRRLVERIDIIPIFEIWKISIGKG